MFLEYCIAKLRQYNLERQHVIYEFYVAETLRLINNNVASIYGGDVITVKLSEMLFEKGEPKESAEEIVCRIQTGLESLGE